MRSCSFRAGAFLLAEWLLPVEGRARCRQASCARSHGSPAVRRGQLWLRAARASHQRSRDFGVEPTPPLPKCGVFWESEKKAEFARKILKGARFGYLAPELANLPLIAFASGFIVFLRSCPAPKLRLTSQQWLG